MIKNKNFKVLITVPELKRPGGVSSLYNILRLNEEPGFDYFEIHGLSTANKFVRVIDLFIIYIKFFIKAFYYDIVQINPSLSAKSFYRDALFVFITRILGKKAVVYWHGWDELFEKTINERFITKLIYDLSFAKADLCIVLGSIFAEKLKALNTKCEIIIESNAASDLFIDNEIQAKEIELDKPINCLFLARLEREKGIYIAIDAINILAKTLPVKLIVAGDGSEMSHIKEFIKTNKIDNIELLGYLNGEEKHAALTNSKLLLLPSYHEGMPISILEGMLYGLPIITRPVGGIPDWVKDGQNGIMISSLESDKFAKAIEKMISDKSFYRTISQNNLIKANHQFTPASAKKRLFSYYLRLTALN